MNYQMEFDTPINISKKRKKFKKSSVDRNLEKKPGNLSVCYRISPQNPKRKKKKHIGIIEEPNKVKKEIRVRCIWILPYCCSR